VPFVVIQVIMVAILIAFPQLVTGNLEKITLDPSKAQIIVPPPENYDESPPDFGQQPEPAQPGSDKKPAEEEPSDLEKQFMQTK
jgi:hypothetical protein